MDDSVCNKNCWWLELDFWGILAKVSFVDQMYKIRKIKT
jgi:hypothetical protein